jgi:hypothetical protein
MQCRCTTLGLTSQMLGCSAGGFLHKAGWMAFGTRTSWHLAWQGPDGQAETLAHLQLIIASIQSSTARRSAERGCRSLTGFRCSPGQMLWRGATKPSQHRTAGRADKRAYIEFACCVRTRSSPARRLCIATVLTANR